MSWRHTIPWDRNPGQQEEGCTQHVACWALGLGLWPSFLFSAPQLFKLTVLKRPALISAQGPTDNHFLLSSKLVLRQREERPRSSVKAHQRLLASTASVGTLTWDQQLCSHYFSVQGSLFQADKWNFVAHLILLFQTVLLYMKTFVLSFILSDTFLVVSLVRD